MTTRKNLTANQAFDILVEFGVCLKSEREWIVGDGVTCREINLGDDGIDANKRGLFSLADVMKLIAYRKMN